MASEPYPILAPYPALPPRAEDLPSDDGVPMETQRHRDQMNVLIDSLRLGLGDRDDCYVGGNMFVYFSLSQARRNDFRGPDVFVVLGTSPRERLSWVVWEEDGKTPDVVIELTSESTRDVDHGEKKRLYAQRLHVPLYYIFDPFTAELEAFRLDPVAGEYVALPGEPGGDVPCPSLGLCLGVRPTSFGQTSVANLLRWIDASGHALPTAPELASRERARADQEQARADQEQARAAAAEAEVARLRRELEKRG